MSVSHGNRSHSPSHVDQAPLSPWNLDAPSTPGSDNDNNSLTLPPINSNTSQHLEYDDDFRLPSLDDSNFFDALPQRATPPPAPVFSRPSNFTLRDLPPPSNQLASQQDSLQRSDYYIADSDSDDLFSDLFLPQSPAEHDSSRPASNQSAPIDLISSSSSPQMAPSKKRKRDDAAESSSAVQAKAKRGATKKSLRSATPKAIQESVEVVDLEAVDGKEDYESFRAKQQAEAIKKQNEEEANRPAKLSEFQCIICMDYPTNLTVTHCGHLFCSECLHSALHAGDKKCCPVCRATINLASSGRGKSKAGVFPLEMKLMTVNRKGKQPAR